MANKIPVSDLIAKFQTMLREHWAYDWSGTQRGLVSCAGAFVWAYGQHGIRIGHGSNYMARSEVEALIPINVANIVPGMAAFKHRVPSDAKYDLPGKYRTGGASFNGDLNDYYHVGLVDTDTSQVLNAQSSSTGFVSSPISKGWSHVALLKQVDYGADVPSAGQQAAPDAQDQPVVSSSATATVYAANGLPVKLRRSASTKQAYIMEVPCGATVTLRGPDSGGWTPVRYGNRDGYMMTMFLQTDAPAAAESSGGKGGDMDHELTLTARTQEKAQRLVELMAMYPRNSPRVTLVLSDLSLAEAKELAALHPDDEPYIEETHG